MKTNINTSKTKATAISSAMSWYSVFVLTIAYICSYIDRSILNLLVGPIKSDLHITDTQFSLLAGLAFAFLYTFLGIPIAKLADTRNRKNLMAAGTFFWSIATTLSGLANSFSQLFIARVGVGIGEAALSPAAYSTIANLFSKDKLGRALGVYSAGVYIGTGLSYLLGGLIINKVSTQSSIDLLGFLTVQPWQVVFFIIGLPGILISLWILTLKEPVREITKVNTMDSTYKDVLQYMKKNSISFITHFVGFSMLTMLFNGVMVWLVEFFVRTYNTPRVSIGFNIGYIVLIFGCLGTWFGGYIMDYLTKKGYKDAAMRTGIISALGILPLILLMTNAPNDKIAIILFCPLMFFMSFPFASAAAALQIISPVHMRARISAFYLFVVNLTGIGLGPTMTALVTDYIFKDETKLCYSLAFVGGIGSIVAAILLFSGCKAFRKTAESIK